MPQNLNTHEIILKVTSALAVIAEAPISASLLLRPDFEIIFNGRSKPTMQPQQLAAYLIKLERMGILKIFNNEHHRGGHKSLDFFCDSNTICFTEVGGEQWAGIVGVDWSRLIRSQVESLPDRYRITIRGLAAQRVQSYVGRIDFNRFGVKIEDPVRELNEEWTPLYWKTFNTSVVCVLNARAVRFPPSTENRRPIPASRLLPPSPRCW